MTQDSRDEFIRAAELTQADVGQLQFEWHEGLALWFTAKLTELTAHGDDVELAFDIRVTIGGSRFAIFLRRATNGNLEN